MNVAAARGRLRENLLTIFADGGDWCMPSISDIPFRRMLPQHADGSGWGTICSSRHTAHTTTSRGFQYPLPAARARRHCPADRSRSRSAPATYSPPMSPLSRIWGIWGSYYNIPKTIFYLLKGDYNQQAVHAPCRRASRAACGFGSHEQWAVTCR